MRTLNIVLTDREYSSLEKMKGRSTWRELIKDLIADFESLEAAQIELEASKPPVMPQIPIILESVQEEAVHKEMAQKRQEIAQDKLYKVKERHDKSIKR